jgi:superfamily II DNA/RNA helicase
MSLDESLISCYQDLVLSEYKKLEAVKFVFQHPASRLTLREIGEFLSKYAIKIDELLSHGLLITYPDGSFRTLHMDLIYRVVNLRTASWSPKIPLEFKLCEPREEYIPSFEELEFGVLKDILPLPKALIDALIEALMNSEYKGLAYHQYHFLKKLLEKKNKCYLLVSPTASGKSLIFYLAIITSILQNITARGTKAIILYPRKALTSDQLLKFQKLLYSLNASLVKRGIRTIYIGVDDGDTPRSPASQPVKRREPFRGIKCIMKDCDGKLRYEPKGSRSVVMCDKCGKIYEEFIPTKEEIWLSPPDIIFSNLSALNRRMMMVPAQNTLGSGLQWIILDEAHVYREELGGHTRWLLNRLISRFSVIIRSPAHFILSSATINNPVGFASKLLGLSTTDIYYESFSDVLKLSKEKFRKITIDLIVAPNPLRSAETLAEELALLLSVWAYSNSKKVILFVDNVSEVERLYTFVVDTIIRERKEHNDHIDPSITSEVNNIENSFSWKSIAGSTDNINPETLAAIIGYHYGELNIEERIRVEDTFKARRCGFLFSTSTLELGMDISDVAAIIQYKVPITSESYVQRIGRAGRSRNTFRIALGILVVTNSPSQIRYVIGNEYLRLIKPDVEIPVAWENEEIKRQHLIFSMLDILALRHHPTYLDYRTEVEPSWSSITDVISSLEELVKKIKKNAIEILNYLNSISNDPAIQKTFDELVSLIEKKIQIIRTRIPSFDPQDIQERIKSLRTAEDKIVAGLKEIEEIRSHVKELLEKFSLQELSDYEQRLLEVTKILRNILGELEKVWG